MPDRDVAESTQPSDSQPNPQRIKQRIAALSSRSYHGPLPPAEEVEHWERILPDAANRFLSLLEDQTYAEIEADRLQLDIYSRIVRQDFLTKTVGQIFGFLIAIVAILAGTYTTLQGHPIAGSFIGGSGVASLAGVFVYERSRQRHQEQPAQDNSVAKTQKKKHPK